MRPQDGGTNITAEECVLWNAMFSATEVGTVGSLVNAGSFVVGQNYTIVSADNGAGGATTSFTSIGASANTVGTRFTATGAGTGTGTARVTTQAWVDGTSSANLIVANSDKHQLLAFGMIIVVDETTFVIDNCVLNTATIDFGLDAIASVQWAGQGGVLRQITSPTIGAGTFSGSVSGNFLQKVTSAPYIANKLSVVTLDEGIGAGGTAYTVPITGGSLTISNNVTYLTPANLATVNKPVTYFTSTRAISGSLNAYLRTGTGFTADLMQTMLTNSATAVSPAFYMNISIGGTGTTKVDFTMPAVVLTIPTVNAEQVVSTTINFTAQGSASSAFDIGAANELAIAYTTPNV